jgi:quercetin dioxygenase-like cupin family protein
MEDKELDRLLREWKAPNAPMHLRPRPTRSGWLAWLITGSIRVPVPVALGAMVLAALWVAAARSEPTSPPETAGPRRSGELARFALTGPLEGFDAVLVEVNFAPGASSREHRHPGFILGYVVDGRLRFGINNEPEQVVPAGGTFFEPHGSLHTAFGSASSDAPARALVFLVVPTGSRLSGPA